MNQYFSIIYIRNIDVLNKYYDLDSNANERDRSIRSGFPLAIPLFT